MMTKQRIVHQNKRPMASHQVQGLCIPAELKGGVVPGNFARRWRSIKIVNNINLLF